MYYLQSRYYNPTWGRFINSDVFAATGQGLLGNNMFAYCGNNPVSRIDAGGCFWDIVFDVASLVCSVIEVVNNPNDIGAWVGLVCDVVDVAIPCVGGLGEAARAVDAVLDAADAVDDVHDTTKIIYNFGGEHKIANQIRGSDALDAWDDFLGTGQTSYNKFTGKNDPNRIFSADGTRSIRFDDHEMKSLGTRKAHFHYEVWDCDPLSNTVYVTNTIQRMR